MFFFRKQVEEGEGEEEGSIETMLPTMEQWFDG